MNSLSRTGTTKRLLIGTLLAYALLVSTHLGEFWPFSIYPMFSRGGHDWSRAIVRDMSAESDVVPWTTVSIDDLPGEAFALSSVAINQNDIANFVAKAIDWSPDRIGAMRKVFGSALGSRSLLLYRAEGRLLDGNRVEMAFTPFVLMTPGNTEFNPSLNISLTPESRP